MTKRAMFIGRWCPFHMGHLSIMQKKIDENKPLLIFVRDTPYDVYLPQLRKRMIEATMAKLKVDAKVEIIDDIESVNYGRGVGYEINEIEVPAGVKRISATEIRSRIDNGDDSWKEFIPAGANKVLENYMSKPGIIVWFFGMPMAGKTTIANLVNEELEKKGFKCDRLDGTVLRRSVSKDLGFSKDGRDRNIERATFISKLLSRHGAIVLCSFITPYGSERIKIRKELEDHATFVEVYVKASLETCKLRQENSFPVWPYYETNTGFPVPYFVEREEGLAFGEMTEETIAVRVLNTLVKRRLELQELIEQKYPNQYLVVKYENLLNSPRETVGKIAGFLGMESTSKTHELIATIKPTTRVYNVDDVLSRCDSASSERFLSYNRLLGYN